MPYSDPNQRRERQRQYYAANKEQFIEKAARWAEENPERRREIARDSARRCWPETYSRRGDQLRELSRIRSRGFDALVVLEASDGMCGICGEDLDLFEAFDIDHVLPLSLGGWHALDNVQPAHPVCNRRKGNRDDFIPATA